MAGTMTFPALLPNFIAEWRLSNTAAGWINGVFYGGYAVAVAVLVSLTDRVDPRRIYLASTMLAGGAALLFGLFATGFWSALCLRALAGVGLAGTYMPGLRILSDRVSGPRATRYLSFYTASFAIGSSASVMAAGLLADWLGWRWAFGLSALGAVAALAIAAWAAAPSAPAPRRAEAAALLDFRPVFRNRAAMGYVLGYAAHSWELFGFRSWLVAFLVVAAGLPAGANLSPITWVATAILLLGVPASILGNEAALRFGRRRALTTIMLASAAIACVVGFLPGLPFALIAVLLATYGVLVMADSASLTVGAV
ncbi:MAG: MFS transporter, partial [Inquilinus sp.]|nr:MFS transporter [Inquilinus sp.]